MIGYLSIAVPAVNSTMWLDENPISRPGRGKQSEADTGDRYLTDSYSKKTQPVDAVDAYTVYNIERVRVWKCLVLFLMTDYSH